MLSHLAAELGKLCLNDRRERILYAAVEHLVAGGDKAVFSRPYGHKADYRLAAGQLFCLLHAFFGYDERYDPCTAQLVTLFDHEARRTGGDHHIAEGIYGAQALKINEQESVGVGYKLYLALFGRCGVHIPALAYAAQDIRGLILMEHIFVLFPDVNIILADAQEHGDILRSYDMTLAEHCVLGNAFDDLSNVVAQYLSHCVFGFYQFHSCPSK